MTTNPAAETNRLFLFFLYRRQDEFSERQRSPSTFRFMVLMKPLLRSGDWRVSFSLMANMAVTKARWKPVTGTRLASSRLKNGALTWTDLQTWLRGLKRPGLRQRGAQSVQLPAFMILCGVYDRSPSFSFFFLCLSLCGSRTSLLEEGCFFFSFLTSQSS